MKNRATFSVETDVLSIEIDAVNADIAIGESGDGTFRLEYPKTRNISAGASDDSVILNQNKYPLSNWKRQKISIFIPAHTVPDIKIHAKTCSLNIKGGIYAELALTIGDGKVKLGDAMFSGAQISGESADVTLNNVTVKGTLFLQVDKGNVLAENTFATRADCKVKRGNIGMASVNCRDCAFNTDRGNITATVVGSEQSFNTTLIAREGILNRESTKHEGADGNFQAYADKGNIVLDFADDRIPLPEITSSLNEDTQADGDGTTETL